MAPKFEDDRHVGFLAADISRLMRTEFDRQVSALGVTRAQWMVLARLARRPGCSQTELADMMEMERATAGRLVDRLEENGLVRREPDPDDRRIRRVFPTDLATGQQSQMRAVADTIVDDALSDLSPDERETLMTLMASVRARLSGIVSASAPTALAASTAAAE
jgi:DNA-binding MarR family transcriptional regulator